jgi:hypothetical protein
MSTPYTYYSISLLPSEQIVEQPLRSELMDYMPAHQNPVPDIAVRI